MRRVQAAGSFFFVLLHDDPGHVNCRCFETNVHHPRILTVVSFPIRPHPVEVTLDPKIGTSEALPDLALVLQPLPSGRPIVPRNRILFYVFSPFPPRLVQWTVSIALPPSMLNSSPYVHDYVSCVFLLFGLGRFPQIVWVTLTVYAIVVHSSILNSSLFVGYCVSCMYHLLVGPSTKTGSATWTF